MGHGDPARPDAVRCRLPCKTPIQTPSPPIVRSARERSAPVTAAVSGRGVAPRKARAILRHGRARTMPTGSRVPARSAAFVGADSAFIANVQPSRTGSH